MKKFFWLIVIFLLVLTFSDHDLIRPYKEKLFSLLQEQSSNLPYSNDKDIALAKANENLQKLSTSWGEGQRKLLTDAGSSVESLLNFNQNYCIDGQFNAQLYGEMLNQACGAISGQIQVLKKH